MNEMPSNEMYSEAAAAQSGNGRFRRLLWGSTLIAVLFLVAAALLLWLDPFGWSVIDRLSGRYDAVATAVPQDSVLYIGVNLLNGNLDDMKALRDTFAAPLADTDANLDDVQQAFTDTLAKEFGITYADDIQPWLGQYLGFALVNLTLDDEYGGVTDAAWLLLAETRNGSASDDFLAKAAAAWVQNNDIAAVSESYNGVTITSFPAERPGEGLALARSGRIVLAAANADVIKQAIDTPKGDSLADKAAYQAAVADLPTARVVTMYVDGAQLTDMVGQMNPSMSGLLVTSATSAIPMSGLRGTAASLTFIDAGLQLDSVSAYNPDDLPATQRAMLNAYTTAPVSLSLYPENTFFYVGAQGLGNIWEAYRDLLVTQMGDPEAFAESMALFARDFGVNPDTDFLPYLNRELAFGLTPGSSGLLAEQLDLPMGALLLVGTDNEAALVASLDTFTGKITDPNSGFGQVNRTESSGLTLYEFTTSYDESIQLTYGIGRDYFYLGTSAADIQALQFGGGTSLADSAGYRAAVASLPDDMVPVMYLDLRSLVNTIRSSVAASGTDMTEFDQVAAVLRPLRTIAAAARVNDTSAHQTTVLFIEK